MPRRTPPVRDDAETVARGVRIVAHLHACPGGGDVAGLADHFRWPAATVARLLEQLTARHLARRVGDRFYAVPSATTRSRTRRGTARSRARR